MTLNLMLANRHGIWQSADSRTVDPDTRRLVDDYSPKQVTIKCRDGTAVIAYTGVGSIRGVNITDWIRQILRGQNRTVDESLILLRERATADIGPIVAGAKIPHVFSVGAFLGERPWFVQVRNYDFFPDSGKVGPPRARFDTFGGPVGAEGAFMALGTPKAVLKADGDTLMRCRAVKPQIPKQFCELLAAINRRASATPAGKIYVSPHCVTTYIPPTGTIKHEFHHAFGTIKSVDSPFLLNGIDMTETMRVLKQMHKAGKNGIQPPSMDEYNAAAQEAFTPRNPLRRR